MDRKDINEDRKDINEFLKATFINQKLDEGLTLEEISNMIKDYMDQKKKGRPRKEFDKKLFENLCSLMCTKEEIAQVFECDEDTVNNWCKREYGMVFKEVWAIHSAKGKVSLRRNMYKMSETNPTMAIWLSKQFLGMTDKSEVFTDNLNRNYIDFSKYTLEQLKELIKSED